jgi:DNA polymerase III alpha subunit (gram-positive type)
MLTLNSQAGPFPLIHDITFFDTEYWTDQDAPKRSWGNFRDLPKYLYQISAVRVSPLEPERIIENFTTLVRPKDMSGTPIAPTDFFVQLTGIAAQEIQSFGIEVIEAITSFSNFAEKSILCSYGNDVLNAIVPNCYLVGLACPFDLSNFVDFRDLLAISGIEESTIDANCSGSICQALGIKTPSGTAHNATFDTECLRSTFAELTTPSAKLGSHSSEIIDLLARMLPHAAVTAG